MELSGDGSETLHGVDGKYDASSGDGHSGRMADSTGCISRLAMGAWTSGAAAASTIVNDGTMCTRDGNVKLELPESLAADLYLHARDGHIDVNRSQNQTKRSP